MLWSAFFGFLKVSKSCAPSRISRVIDLFLRCTDIQLPSDFMKVALNKIKSSQASPVSVLTGGTYRSCCAVRDYRSYIKNRLNFVYSKSLAFIFADSTALIRQKINSTLRALLGRQYSSHGFRIRAATTASEAGLLPVENCRLGRWKSNAYKLYIRSTNQSVWAARMAQQF